MINVKPITMHEAKAIVLPNHYSGKWNSHFGTAGNFGVYLNGELLGAAVYGHLMNPGSYRSIADVDRGQIIELNRLWIDDRLGRNTESQVIAKSLKWFRQNTPVQIVQSFADGRLGCGTIYKASNFRYYGKSRTLFIRHVDTGEILHGAPLSNTARPKGMLYGNEWIVDGKAEAFYTDTYRYMYPLTNHGQRAIKLEELPYPEYRKGEDIDNDYKPPLAVIARCVVLCGYLGDKRYAKFDDYLHCKCDPATYSELIDEARNNRTIAARFNQCTSCINSLM